MRPNFNWMFRDNKRGRQFQIFFFIYLHKAFLVPRKWYHQIDHAFRSFLDCGCVTISGGYLCPALEARKGGSTCLQAPHNKVSCTWCPPAKKKEGLTFGHTCHIKYICDIKLHRTSLGTGSQGNASGWNKNGHQLVLEAYCVFCGWVRACVWHCIVVLSEDTAQQKNFRSSEKQQ